MTPWVAARAAAFALLLPAFPTAARAGAALPSRPDEAPPTDVTGTTSRPLDMSGAFGEWLTLDGKGLTFHAPDEAVKLRISGRLHIDYGNVARRNDPDPIFRRSWLEAYLSIRGGIEVAVQYDFASEANPIFDALVSYSGVQPIMVSLGNMREPMSLDRLTNTNTTLFTETALPIAFTPIRSFGGLVGINGDRWTGTFGVFGQNASFGVAGGGVAGVGRLTVAPILEKSEVLHLGVSASYRALERDGTPLSFSSVPETFLYSRAESLVDTGAIADAEAVRRWAAEGAYALGPVKIQAEYIRTDVDRRAGAPALTFDGAYVQGEWVLNGQGRRYELKPVFGSTYATFAGVHVPDSQRVANGGIGVFEIGARLSRIDLQDRRVRGGIETDVSAGLNWYPDNNMRTMFDYIHAETTGAPDGHSGERDLFVGRLQVYW